LAEAGFVAKRAIAYGNEGFVFKTLGVKVLAQFAHHLCEGRRKIMRLFGLEVSGFLFGGRGFIFTRLRTGVTFRKTDRPAAR
jgi:hypothetical protein